MKGVRKTLLMADVSLAMAGVPRLSPNCSHRCYSCVIAVGIALLLDASMMSVLHVSSVSADEAGSAKSTVASMVTSDIVFHQP